jgi:diaminopimelate decarboxylase
MSQKLLPFSLQQIEQIIKTYPTPFHIYDEKGIKKNARALNATFSWAQGFREFFAVKAAPNPFLMKLFQKEGMGADCSSLPELLLAERCGIMGEQIMFSSNDTRARGDHQSRRYIAYRFFRRAGRPA